MAMSHVLFETLVFYITNVEFRDLRIVSEAMRLSSSEENSNTKGDNNSLFRE